MLGLINHNLEMIALSLSKSYKVSQELSTNVFVIPTTEGSSN